MDFPISVPSIGLVDGKFVDEDPLSGSPGSLIPSAWGNAVTLEVLNVIEAAGLAPDEDNNAQLLQAINSMLATATPEATETVLGLVKRATQLQVDAGTNDTAAVTPKKLATAVQNQTLTAFATAGTATALTLAPTPAIQAYAPNQRFSVKFSVTGGLNPTLNVSAKGPKSLKQYDSTGAKVAAAFVADQISDVIYDGTDMVVLDPLPSTVKQTQIQPIAAAVAANALTATLNPTSLDFRSPTLGSGTVNSRHVVSPISLIVPAGATLGTASAQPSRLVELAIDNAGTVEVAIVNLSGGVSLDETTLINTTAISAGALSANVIYSATARTGVPFRVVGIIDSTQPTAGQWTNPPSLTQGAGGQAISAMSTLGYGQTWQDMIASRALGTTYTNTTGRPIVVNAQVITSIAAHILATINGVPVRGGDAVTGQRAQLSIIIPNGVSYSLALNAGTGTQLNWVELR